jgi:hypothetical protein
MKVSHLVAASTLGVVAGVMPLAVPSASAATGGPCSVQVSVGNAVLISVPGTISANNACVVAEIGTGPISIPTQLACGTTVDILGVKVEAICP